MRPFIASSAFDQSRLRRHGGKTFVLKLDVQTGCLVHHFCEISCCLGGSTLRPIKIEREANDNHRDLVLGTDITQHVLDIGNLGVYEPEW